MKQHAPQTVQQSIPYQQLYADGICRIADNKYSKTIQYFDVNYQLAQNEDKLQIFESYCSFLNYFDSSIAVQMTFINQPANMKDFVHSIDIPQQKGDLNSVSTEYGNILKGQFAKGNSRLDKRKYITFTIEAESHKAAKMRIARIEADIISNFNMLGVLAKPLDGRERMAVLHAQLHPNGQEKLRFDWADIAKTGLSTKDFIAPSGLEFSADGKYFRMGSHIGAVSFVQILAPELTDRMLADYLDMDDALTVNMHIQSIDQTEAIKNIKRKLSDLDSMRIEEQKKAVRSGYDMSIIPTDLSTYGDEAKNCATRIVV